MVNSHAHSWLLQVINIPTHFAGKLPCFLVQKWRFVFVCDTIWWPVSAVKPGTLDVTNEGSIIRIVPSIMWLFLDILHSIFLVFSLKWQPSCTCGQERWVLPQGLQSWALSEQLHARILFCFSSSACVKISASTTVSQITSCCLVVMPPWKRVLLLDWTKPMKFISIFLCTGRHIFGVFSTVFWAVAEFQVLSNI